MAQLTATPKGGEPPDLSREAALDAVPRLQPVTLAWIAEGAQTRVGFIAEDLPNQFSRRC